MKKILFIFGTALVYFLWALLLIILSPIIIIAILCGGLASLYASLWRRLRRDPVRNITLPEITDDTWQDAETTAQFIAAFDRFTSTLAQLSNAKQSRDKYEELEAFDNLSERGDAREVKIIRTLKTDKALLRVSFRFKAASSSDNGEARAALIDPEDQCSAWFPYVDIEIEEPRYKLKQHFTITTAEDAWLAICVLQGKARYVQETGQLWCYIARHKAWLVRYKADSSSYGLRERFSPVLARKYGHDKQY